MSERLGRLVGIAALSVATLLASLAAAALLGWIPLSVRLLVPVGVGTLAMATVRVEYREGARWLAAIEGAVVVAAVAVGVVRILAA